MGISAHRGTVSCLAVRSQGVGMPPRVFSAGEDGALRVWNGREMHILVESSDLTRHRISCMAVSGNKIFMGTSGGEIVITTTDGRPVRKFSAHKGVVTCLQVVNRGRMFTGSMDGTVKFYTAEGEVMRQFPIKPADSRDPILSIKAISANLLFTGSDQGVIRVYNLRQELIRVLKTSSLNGVPLNLMEVIHANNKVSIICAHKTYLTMWYLTLQKDNFGEYEIMVDAVKTISSRMPNGRITAIQAVFVNPLRTSRPCVYLGNTGGLVQVIAPTGKFGTLHDNYNRRVLAPKFKQYTFKDVMAPISSVCAGGGRIYAGTIEGGLFMWKECLAMLNLRKFQFGRVDTHGYRGRRTSRSASVTVSIEPTQEEPEQDPEALRSFAKIADSDISESEMENDFYSPEPTMISLSESIPDVSSGRPSRASTVSASTSTINRTSRAATTNSPSPQSNFGSINRSNSSMSSISRPASHSFSSNSVPNVSRQPEIKMEAPQQLSYEQEIIKLLNDSVAGLALLPEPSMIPSNVSQRSMSSTNISQLPPSTMSMMAPSPVSMSNSNPSISSATQSMQNLSMNPTPQPPTQAQGDQRCVVCLDKGKESILYPCGHQCVCQGCGKELVTRKMKCPMCRADIKDYITPFK